eukprot:2569304-Rhodomonas_salina.1
MPWQRQDGMPALHINIAAVLICFRGRVLQPPAKAHPTAPCNHGCWCRRVGDAAPFRQPSS